MKVVIVGGGTVGWMTSLYLSSIKNGNEYINIFLRFGEFSKDSLRT